MLWSFIDHAVIKKFTQNWTFSLLYRSMYGNIFANVNICYWMSFFANSGEGNAAVLWRLRVLLPPGWGPGVCERDDYEAWESPTQPKAVCPLERWPAWWGSLRHWRPPDRDEVSDSILLLEGITWYFWICWLFFKWENKEISEVRIDFT